MLRSVMITGLRRLHRMPVRGKSRLTIWLAKRNAGLQTVPIQIADWPAVHVDLRRYDGHRWLAGSPWTSSPLEVAEQIVIRQIVKPGQVVYDIGANIGLHTALLSRIVGDNGHVYAFEPNPMLLPGLRNTVAGMRNGTLLECALSDEHTEMDLYVPAEDHTSASLADWTQGREGARRTMKVPVRRLDELGLPCPDFIKCDVEGAESFAFRGGESLLNRELAPIILFEANVHNVKGFALPITAARDYLASLPVAKYSFFQVGEGDGGLRPVQELDPVHSNIVAVPGAKRSSVQP